VSKDHPDIKQGFILGRLMGGKDEDLLVRIECPLEVPLAKEVFAATKVLIGLFSGVYLYLYLLRGCTTP
jgi:hypothetical protein